MENVNNQSNNSTNSTYNNNTSTTTFDLATLLPVFGCLFTQGLNIAIEWYSDNITYTNISRKSKSLIKKIQKGILNEFDSWFNYILNSYCGHLPDNKTRNPFLKNINLFDICCTKFIEYENFKSMVILIVDLYTFYTSIVCTVVSNQQERQKNIDNLKPKPRTPEEQKQADAQEKAAAKAEVKKFIIVLENSY